MTLYVFKCKDTKQVTQHAEFRETRLASCNTKSPRGLKLKMSSNQWYFEVEAPDLYNEDSLPIKGYMCKGPIRYAAEFDSMFMLKHTLLHLNRWTFGFRK